MEIRLMARIAFDLDGTLIDSAPDIHAIANAILAEEGTAPVTLDQIRNFIGNGVNDLVGKLRAARNLPDSAHQRLLDDFIARYDTAVTLTRLYPNVADVLAALRSDGHDLGICTNKLIRPCHAVLAHLGIDGFFSTVWGGDSLAVRKPDPAPLHAAFAALGQGPRLYVGDSEVDAETARRAKVPFLLFTEGYRKLPVSQMPHDAVFSDFADLPGLVAERLSATV